MKRLKITIVVITIKDLKLDKNDSIVQHFSAFMNSKMLKIRTVTLMLI